jgi:putative ABC transport system permease protein
MQTLWQDLRFGARMLAKQPGFTLIAVLTLALGIGINTAVFSVADAVLFRPLPFAEPHRLAEIWQQITGSQSARPGLRWEAFEQWRQQTEVFERVEAYDPRNFTLTGGKEPETIAAPAVSPGLFALLGVNPQLGRLFQPEEAQPGNGRVALISDGFWRRYFGGNPDALGKTLTLNDQPYTVVGVMPPKFKFPYGKFELWVPLALTPMNEMKRPNRLNVVARLRADVSLPAAQSRLDLVSSQLSAAKPDPQGWGVKLSALDARRINPGPRRALLALLGAVALVMLLACANSANLWLSRAAARQGEMAIRQALGAGRWRLLRQLLTESVLLALLAAAAGLLLAWWGVDLLRQLTPDELTFLSVNEISLDRRVLLFTLGLALLTGVVSGLLPAIKSSRSDLQQALKGAGRAATADRAQNRLRRALVVAEITLSLALLVGAGLMMRAFLRLSSVPPGFDPRNLIAATLALPQQRYPTLAQEEEFFARLRERMLATPGVEAVTVAAGVPPQGGGITFGLDVEIEGRPPEPFDRKLVLPFSQVDSNYFQTMRIPLLQGRNFGAEDTANAPPVMIINEEMARHYWPNESPVGKRLRLTKTGKWFTVVGVSGDVNLGKPGFGYSKMEIYYPWSQETRRSGQRTLIVRATTEASKLITAVKGGIWAFDKDQPIYQINTVENLLSDALAEPRFYLTLLGFFAGVTLLLVSMGIYGVMSYLISQRRHEIGIRIALGAQTRDVLRLLLRDGLWLTAMGISAGALTALALGRWIKNLLYEQSATDPLTFALIALLLTGVALLACYVPARRVSKIDPLTALRHE